MEEHYPEILKRYMGEERNWSDEYIDQTTRIASGICGASQGSSTAAKTSEPLNRKERAEYSEQVRPIEENALKQWAVKNSLWV